MEHTRTARFQGDSGKQSDKCHNEIFFLMQQQAGYEIPVQEVFHINIMSHMNAEAKSNTFESHVIVCWAWTRTAFSR
jgi:hypothetical protein